MNSKTPIWQCSPLSASTACDETVKRGVALRKQCRLPFDAVEHGIALTDERKAVDTQTLGFAAGNPAAIIFEHAKERRVLQHADRARDAMVPGAQCVDVGFFEQRRQR